MGTATWDGTPQLITSYGETSTLVFTTGDWINAKQHIDKFNYPGPGACIYVKMVENDVEEFLRFGALKIDVRRSHRTLVRFFN